MSDGAISQALVNGSGATIIDRLLAWIKAHERCVLFAAVAFQIGVLLCMVILRSVMLLRGETILLRVLPVDPRDLLRGDYVMLSYDFSRSPPPILSSGKASDAAALAGGAVYVPLVPEPDGKHWRGQALTLQRPATGKFIRGRLNNLGRPEFGIESFFLQEGTGHKYEEAVRQRRLSAEIALTPEGDASLRRLVIENAGP